MAPLHGKQLTLRGRRGALSETQCRFLAVVEVKPTCSNAQFAAEGVGLRATLRNERASQPRRRRLIAASSHSVVERPWVRAARALGALSDFVGARVAARAYVAAGDTAVDVDALRAHAASLARECRTAHAEFTDACAFARREIMYAGGAWCVLEAATPAAAAASSSSAKVGGIYDGQCVSQTETTAAEPHEW